MKEHRLIFEKAFIVWGFNLQKIIAIEEFSELIKSLCKDYRGQGTLKDNTELLNNIIDETADCYIMLEQIKVMYNIESNVEERINLKINRLKERLNIK